MALINSLSAPERKTLFKQIAKDTLNERWTKVFAQDDIQLLFAGRKDFQRAKVF